MGAYAPRAPLSDSRQVWRSQLSKKLIVGLLATFVLASGHHVHAQQARIYRVGVIFPGGPYQRAIDGLKDGLGELGLAEGKHYVLEIRDLKGDRKAEEQAARSLERAKVDLIYAIPTNIAVSAKRVTTEVPIVFAVGSDPVVAGLVESFPRPGGRVTGVHYLAGELTAKRLEILKALLPELHRVVTFYDPGSTVAMAGVKTAREAARQLKIRDS